MINRAYTNPRIAMFMGHLPWLGKYYLRVPRLGKNLKRFREFAKTRVAIRMEQGSLSKDIFHHLVSVLA